MALESAIAVPTPGTKVLWESYPDGAYHPGKLHEGIVLDRDSFVKDQRQHWLARRHAERHPDFVVINTGIRAIPDANEIFVINRYLLVY